MLKSLLRRKSIPSDEQSPLETDDNINDPTNGSPSNLETDSSSDPNSKSEQPENPILSDEDELFLRQAVSEDEATPLPPRPGAENDQDTLSTVGAVDTEESKVKKKSKWEQYKLSRNRVATADDLMSAAEAIKSQPETPESSESETDDEKKDATFLLNRLDLSAINNRVVGLSNDTQKLLEAFNQVLKDLVNGVPTAYDDLEKLLTDRQKQLDKLYGGLPPFLQKLVKTIPARAYAVFAPQIAAAMTPKKTDDDTNDNPTQSEDDKKTNEKRTVAMPSLKSLVTKKGAVVAMLRSIVSFIETRFPALLVGTNVVMSVAVFVLLFVFWYCHKRGKETRLDREQAEIAEIPDDKLEQDIESQAEAQSADTELQRNIETIAKEIEQSP